MYTARLVLYHIFPHYLINGTIFGKRLLNIKCVLIFSLQLPSEIRLILRRIKQDIIINVHSSSCIVPYFSTLSHNRYDFRKKVIEHKMCVLIYSLQLPSEIVSFWEELSKILSQMYTARLVLYPLFLFDCNEIWIFSTDARKILKYHFAWKFFQLGRYCSMRTDGHDEANRRFLQFCKGA